MRKKHALITGGAGFIASHLAETLLESNWQVTTIENFDPFYSIETKKQNIASLLLNPDYHFVEGDITDDHLAELLPDDYDIIIHLAAKAGVRPSISNPFAYQHVNVYGTHKLLELSKERGIKDFVFGSSSSVYGINPNVPWREDDYVLQPISPYASTKVSGELLGHTYSHLYGIRFTALRFFTVFGPRQRPDLAINKFVSKMLKGEEIPVFGDGSTRRDYTFVGDIVNGIKLAMDFDESPYEIINLASGYPISLADMIGHIEDVVGIEARKNYLPEQPGDVPQTYADVSKAKEILSYEPQTSFKEGVAAFYQWLEKSKSALKSAK